MSRFHSVSWYLIRKDTITVTRRLRRLRPLRTNNVRKFQKELSLLVPCEERDRIAIDFSVF